MSSQSQRTTRQRWVERIARFDASDMTVAQFCAVEDFSQASFYQWRRKLRSESSPDDNTVKDTLANFVPVKLPALARTANPSATPSVESGRRPATTVLSVELPGGIRVRIQAPASSGDGHPQVIS